jgi:hypothetical protein
VYLAVGAILLLAVILSLADLVHGVTAGSLATVLLAACALVTLVKMRMYSLSVQDRIIRLEMRLRLERVLPADLKGRIAGLSLQQLIGLRFASDEELPALVQQVFDGPITNADEIKKRIKNWQADHLRV